MTPDDPFAANTALVVAHPAHELRLLGWLSRVNPTVHALTDGRGRHNVPRIERTGRLLDDLDCHRGSLFGDLTDAGVYAALLGGDHRLLMQTTQRLADAFVRDRTEVVVVDAHEDAFLSHDVLNAMVRSAVLAASDRLGRGIACFDFAIEHAPDECEPELLDQAVWVRLGPEELRRKLAIARSFGEVRIEVEEAFQTFGEKAFATECLRPLHDLEAFREPRVKPIYEAHGERLVREGHYPRVVRYEEHVRPFCQRLRTIAPLVGAA